MQGYRDDDSSVFQQKIYLLLVVITKQSTITAHRQRGDCFQLSIHMGFNCGVTLYVYVVGKLGRADTKLYV